MSDPLSSLPAKPPAVLATTETADENVGAARTPPKAPRRGASGASIPQDSEESGETSSPFAEPPLPDEQPPPLPDGPPPVATTEDDGWEPLWDDNAQAFYFYNRISQTSQWENPRLPNAMTIGGSVKDDGPPGTSSNALLRKPVTGGYDPAIHGDYDPDADYAKVHEQSYENATGQNGANALDPTATYTASATFNRFTGKWQQADLNPEKFSDENKSRRQMNAFFDVDAAANSHDGRSLKAERSGKKISKADLKAYREKRKEKKEEKRRAWLRD